MSQENKKEIFPKSEFKKLKKIEAEAIRNVLQNCNLPPTFENFPLIRTTNKDWEVLGVGNYDEEVEGISAADLYYRTARVEGALPLNQWIEWPGMMEAVGNVLADRQPPINIFEVGGGDGRQMKEILTYNRNINKAVFIEKSARMIEMAKDNLIDHHVKYYQYSAQKGLDYLLKENYDLGVGSLMMHYLEPWQMALFFLRLKNVLKDDGTFLFSGGTPDFNIALLREMYKENLPQDVRRLSWYMFDIKGDPVFEMKTNLYLPEDYIRITSALGLKIKYEVMKPKIPVKVKMESLSSELKELLYSPVWNLYQVTK